MSGQTVYLKLRPAETIDDLVIHTEDGRIAGGMKMANGTNTWLQAIRYKVSDSQHRADRTGEMRAVLSQGTVNQRLLVWCIGG